MDTFVTILCVFLIIFAIAIIALVLFQAKSSTMGSALAGSASDTFYGKSKNKQRDAVLSKITTILTIVFSVIAIVVYILQ